MQTQCPKCQTIFNITQQHLNIANGQVRCTQCQTVFDGHVYMQNDNTPEPPKLEDIASYNTNLDHKINIGPKTSHIANALIYPELREESYNTPGLKRIVAKVFFALLSLIAFIILLLQLAYFKRSELAQNPTLAPHIHKICNAIQLCNIPIKHTFGQFQLETRNIHTHPTVAKALVVTATFRNNANFTQPYPTLVLSMSNIGGEEIATRRFLPKEYLNKFSDEKLGIATQQSTSISLEIVDPGDQATAFEINFQ